jgi:hypothetical protein
VPNADQLPVSLPTGPGYDRLLGVPAERVERLRELRLMALDGELTREGWEREQAKVLDGVRVEAEPAQLRRLEKQASDAAESASENFEQYLFLAGLALDLRSLQLPDPDRELAELQNGRSAALGAESRATLDRHVAAMRTMTGRTEPERYEPASRMLQALRVGTLEETYRWLKAAVEENPGTSVQDLLTRAAIEVAEAKMELDRYDDLSSSPEPPRRR